jgi:hypothetical protein
MALFATTTFSLVGVCFAIIFRSQATAILVLVGAFVVEKLVGIFIGDEVAYLPYGSLTPLLRLEGSVIGAVPAAIALALTTVAPNICPAVSNLLGGPSDELSVLCGPASGTVMQIIEH